MTLKGFQSSPSRMKPLECILSAITLLLAIQAFSTRQLPSHTENEIGYSKATHDKILKGRQGVKSNSYWRPKENAVEQPLLVGSFNIQTLNKKKLKNAWLMPTIERIVHRYDMIIILELMTNDTKLMEKFAKDINDFAPVTYNMTVSIDPHVNEFIAIFYRTDKLRILKSESYHDPEKFYRKPFFVLFDSPTLRDMKQFGLIGYHVKPSEAVREINALADVYDFMKAKYDVEDILIMGDFNADCDYVKEQHWDSISLWTREEFTWAIPKTEDTTTNYRSCALDRIAYAGENMNSGVILSSARAFDYRYELDVSMKEARSISDHWPIEVKIRGKMSKLAEKHLSSDICFAIRDSRSINVTQDEILEACKIAQFKSTSMPSGVSLRKNTRIIGDMLAAITRLKNALPSAISDEQSEAIVYKAQNGGLGDGSSYADSQQEIFKVVVSLLNDTSEVLICKTTTVN